MRHLDLSVLNSLDLDLAEIEFLRPLATQQHAKTCKKYNFPLDENDRFHERLGQNPPKGLTHKQHIELRLMHTLAKWKVAIQTVERVPTRLHEGLGTHHSSYGCIGLGNPSANQTSLVGSASLSGHYMEFDIKFARLDVNDRFRTALMGTEGILRAAMSVEQFSMLIRGDDGVHVPAKLQLKRDGFMDAPPALAPTIAHELSFEAAVRDLAQPFLLAMNEITAAMEDDLAKKPNRERLVRAGEQAQQALARVKEAIANFTVEAGEKEAARVQRQFNQEIAERLGQLGIANLADIIPRLT